tara:strand:- start:594 stop:1124 length:531 start_codon:yes stop_codon:yes gene_type:complete
MKKEIFAIPIFEDTIDLELFKVPPCKDGEVKETWDSKTPTSFDSKLDISEDAMQHLVNVIERNLGPEGLIAMNPRIEHVWRNVYKESDYQDPHIHPVCQWSFIIYETVRSKTSFLNPSLGIIQEKYGMNCRAFPPDYKPDLGPGSIIIFPSMLLHFVNSGNIGSTISGNIYMDYGG